MGMDYLKSLRIDIYTPTEAEKLQFKNLTQPSAIAWLKKNVGNKWVDGVLKATMQAEKDLGD